MFIQVVNLRKSLFRKGISAYKYKVIMAEVLLPEFPLLSNSQECGAFVMSNLIQIKKPRCIRGFLIIQIVITIILFMALSRFRCPAAFKNIQARIVFLSLHIHHGQHGMEEIIV